MWLAVDGLWSDTRLLIIWHDRGAGARTQGAREDGRMAQEQRADQTIVWGIVFGIIAGVIQVGVFMAQRAGIGRGLVFLVGALAFIVYVVLYLVAGILAARATGNVGSGAVAGLLAAIIVSVSGAAAQIITFVPNGSRAVGGVGFGRLSHRPGFLLVVLIVRLIIVVALSAGIGAGVGALGGLIGLSGRAPQPYQESMYQGLPAASGPP